MKYIIKVVAPLIFVLFGFNFVSALTTGLPACNQTFSESNGSLVKRSCDNGPVEYYANGVKITETEYTAKLAELNKQGVICTKNYDGNALTYDDPTTVDPNPSVFLRVVCVKDQYGAYYINNEKVTYGVFFDAYLKKVSQAFSKSSETVVQNKEAFSFMITRQECLKALSTFEQVKEKSLGTYVKFCSDPNSLTMSHGYSFYPQKSGVKVMYTKYDQNGLNTISDPSLADPVEEKKIFIAKSNENVSLSSCGLNLITSNNKLGNSNADVKNIQIVLKQAEYLKATPNGYYGNATKLAVRNFQKSIDSNGDYSSRYTLGVVNPWTAKKLNDLCKKIESQTTGQSNPSSPTSASIAKPISSICTMEARMCADGSVMPRDSNCAWREDKCPQASNSSKNTLPVITSFTSKVIDSSVTGKASISWSTSQSADVAIDLICSSDYVVIVADNGNKVSCGGRNGLGIWRGHINGTIGFSFSGNTSPATVQFVITVLDKNGQYTNQKQTTSITFPAQGNVQGNIIPSSGSVQFGPVITSMSEFTVDGLGNIIGTGFDPMSNAVTMNGITKQLTTSAKGDVIPFYAKDFNLVEGAGYVVKISTGSFTSNSYGFTFPCRAGTISTAWSGVALCTPIGSLLFSPTSYSATYTQGDTLPSTSASDASLYSNTKFFQNGTIKNTSNADITYSISVLNQPLWLNSSYSKERMTLKSGQEIGLSAYLDPATVANTPGVKNKYSYFR
jgi:peptidoglycan hydrolase-like protein with peptidoglycan-binding domain